VEAELPTRSNPSVRRRSRAQRKRTEASEVYKFADSSTHGAVQLIASGVPERPRDPQQLLGVVKANPGAPPFELAGAIGIAAQQLHALIAKHAETSSSLEEQRLRLKG
jgi:hypothetical protein